VHAPILRYFVAVANAGSIRKASEELHVASSALSRQIQKLEYQLGTPLFERYPDGLRLTQAGTVTLRHAKSTLERYDLLKSEIGALTGSYSGVVRVSCLDSFRGLILTLISVFRAAHTGAWLAWLPMVRLILASRSTSAHLPTHSWFMMCLCH
jgi:DNA-binding transcriptional LysR family regulator